MVQVTDDHLEAAADASGAVSVVSAAAFAGAPQAVAQVSKHAGVVRAEQVLGCERWQRCLPANKGSVSLPLEITMQFLFYSCQEIRGNEE